MGIARIVCAITMAVGVKSNARKPSGPECERARYKTRPTTTGGKPKNALIKTMTNRRPRNGKIARAVPIGKLMAVATAVAAKLTLIDSPTISRKSRNLSGPSFKQSGWRAAVLRTDILAHVSAACGLDGFPRRARAEAL